MKRLFTGIMITVLMLIGISAYALYANQIPWQDPPGFFKRLGVYLSQNIAYTSADALFPELRPRQYEVPVDRLFNQLPVVINKLGWDIQSINVERMELKAVVITRWLRFRDDITIRAIPLSTTTSTVEIRSASRVGRADYGANLGHILQFYTEFER